MNVANTESIEDIVCGLKPLSDIEYVAETVSARGEEHTAILMLSDNGIIFDCNNAAGDLLDCEPSRLTKQHISIILPQLAEIALMRGASINPNLRFLSRLGYTFETVGMSGARFDSTVFFNEIENLDNHFLRVILRPVFLNKTVA
jgi:hypothetical protein